MSAPDVVLLRRAVRVISRRTFIATSALGVLIASLRGEAQQAVKGPRIGVLDYGSASARQGLWHAFREGLREAGYVEGQSIAVEYRWGDGKNERLRGLAEELVQLKVDLIATAGVPAALAARDSTKAIPIVFCSVGEAVRTGLVTSLARPSSNVTGVTTQTTELSSKLLELLREIVGPTSRPGVLWDENNPAGVLYASEIRRAATSLALPLHGVGVRSPKDFDGAFSAMRTARVNGLIVTGGALFFGERQRLADLAAKNSLPTFFPQKEYAEAGGLVAYGADLAHGCRRAAAYVAKILKGAKPADLPVEQPTKFDFVVNMRTANALGLTIPPSIMIRADTVIE